MEMAYAFHGGGRGDCHREKSPRIMGGNNSTVHMKRIGYPQFRSCNPYAFTEDSRNFPLPFGNFFKKGQHGISVTPAAPSWLNCNLKKIRAGFPILFLPRLP
jgi:hypothetical protein